MVGILDHRVDGMDQQTVGPCSSFDHCRRTFVMYRLFAVCGLLCVAAITPGPNNLVVLRASSQGGIRAALPAIAGIVLGGLLLLAWRRLAPARYSWSNPGGDAASVLWERSTWPGSAWRCFARASPHRMW